MSRRAAALVLALSIAGLVIYFAARPKTPAIVPTRPSAAVSTGTPPEYGAAAADANLEAERGCTFACTVIDPDKRALAGAPIKLMPADGTYEVANGTSDENGRWVFTGIAPGRYRLFIHDSRYRPRSGETMSCERNDSLSQTVELERGLVIAGRVLDESGAPVAGANVGSSAEARASVTTDDRGRFELTGLDVGPINVFATAPGYAPRQVHGLRAGSRNTDLRLERPARARGAVDAGSAKSLTVSACQYDTYFAKEVCVARRLYEPPEKEFVLEPLPSGTFDLVFEADGHRTERVRVVLESGKDAVLHSVELKVGAQSN